VPTRSVPESQGRETRILLLIVAVSIALLLLLAQLRYPAADLPVIAPTQAPVIALPAPRGFEDLNERLAALLTQISSRVLAVEIEPVPGPAGRRRAEEPAVSMATAVRVRPDIAVVRSPRGTRPRADAAAGIEVLAADEVRELAVLRVAPNLDAPFEQSAEPFEGMSYVGVVFATRNGPTLQPAYVGHVGHQTDERWSTTLMDLGPMPAWPAGTPMFSLEGRFLGFVIGGSESNLLLPAPALHEVVGTAAGGQSAP